MYYLHAGGENRGPYELDQVRSMWSMGVITADAVYWDAQSSTWRPVSELVRSSEPSLATMPPPPPSPRAALPGPPAGLRPGAMPPPGRRPQTGRGAPAVRVGRTAYGVENGACWPSSYSVAIISVVGDWFLHPVNIWAHLGFAVVAVPGGLWFGYKQGLKAWDRRYQWQTSPPPKPPSADPVVFFIILAIILVGVYCFVLLS